MTPATDPRGLFLAFEGVEGSGKTTQVRLLSELLARGGREPVVAREPGSTPLGERVRATVLADLELAVPARSELFLMLAARAAFVDQVVRPALAGGRVVIADRFELSTLAYQGGGRGLPADEIAECNRIATGGVSPHATILLELDPQEGARRQRSAGMDPDRMERAGAEFHARVAAAYRQMAGRVAGVVRVDAGAPPAEVHARVWPRSPPAFRKPFRQAGLQSRQHQPRFPRGLPASLLWRAE
jgi:dTMP kinase